MILTETQVQMEYELGKRRASQENSLLDLMFNGSSSIRFVPEECYRKALFIHEKCDLKDFCDHSDIERQESYLSLTEPMKVMCRSVAALDSLVKRGLVARKVWASNNWAPEDGWSDEENNRDTWFGDTAHLSRALCSTLRKDRICSVEEPQGNAPPVDFEIEAVFFQLTSKGYNVALTLQDHRDQEERFKQQALLSKRAIDASESSVKVAKQSTRIARTALLAAFFIAIGSLGNLWLSFHK